MAELIIAHSDYQKIASLVSNVDTPTAALLGEELDRASVVADTEVPSDVVAMNSKVRYLDLDSDKESEVTLVYPHEASIEEHKVSILAPVGAALIGLKVGQKIKWPLPNGKVHELKVLSVDNAALIAGL